MHNQFIATQSEFASGKMTPPTFGTFLKISIALAELNMTHNLSISFHDFYNDCYAETENMDDARGKYIELYATPQQEPPTKESATAPETPESSSGGPPSPDIPRRF